MRTVAEQTLLITLILLLICIGLLQALPALHSDFAAFYADNIRGHLFTGFLALGGFLLSLKTFIIVTMKDGVYDTDAYRKVWRESKKRNVNFKLYTPLKELSDLLFYAILASIGAAIMQMTFGLCSIWWIALICVFSAVYASALLVRSLFLIKDNLDRWFDYLEPEEDGKPPIS